MEEQKRKLTHFMFFKNTPLVNFENTIHFPSNEARDDFFVNHPPYYQITTSMEYNFIRDRGTLRTPIAFSEFQGVNYCTFISDFEPKRRYYAYVDDIQYLNDGTTKCNLLIDVVMTFTQGKVLNELKNLTIEREHLTKGEKNARLLQLRTNDDILKTYNKLYIDSRIYRFKDLGVIFQCSADLSKDFGTSDKPKITTSSGTIYDGITSPVDLYYTEFADFTNLSMVLADYPWISQNIKNILLIPNEMIRGDSKTNVAMKSGNFKRLYKLKSGGTSKIFQMINLNINMKDLMAMHKLDLEEDMHLLRSEYTTTEFYTMDGQSLFIDNGYLDSMGVMMRAQIVTGYKNEIRVFPEGYKSGSFNIANDNTEKLNADGGGLQKGAYLNNALVFNSFDEIPILIDNYKLNLANNANRRNLAESRLLTNQVKNVLDPSANIQDRLYNTVSILSNFTPTALGEKITKEYDFYKDQKAEFADMALTPPTETAQSTGNGFQIANGIYGVTEKIASLSPTEWNRVKKYYKLFGYQINEDGMTLSDVESMSICNYVKFKGNWQLDGVDVTFNKMLKIIFENGVRLWHSDGSKNPMVQNILNNKMVK